MKRLGKNLNGYFGETLDIRAVLHDIKAVAQSHGWASELFYKIGDLELFALHRPARQASPTARVIAKLWSKPSSEKSS